MGRSQPHSRFLLLRCVPHRRFSAVPDGIVDDLYTYRCIYPFHSSVFVVVVGGGDGDGGVHTICTMAAGAKCNFVQHKPRNKSKKSNQNT